MSYLFHHKSNATISNKQIIVNQTQVLNNLHSMYKKKKWNNLPSHSVPPFNHQRNISTLSENPTQRIHFLLPFSSEPDIQRPFRAFPSPPLSI